MLLFRMETITSIYTKSCNTNFLTNPYGMKMFDLGSHGRIVPVSLTSNKDGINLTAYAVSGEDKNLYVTLINKEHGSGAREANVTIAPGESITKAQVMFLSVTKGDVAATSGVTLGGAEIDNDASWKGTWTPLSSPSDSGEFTVRVPAATAAVIKLTPK
jgi:hypothetical protein